MDRSDVLHAFFLCSFFSEKHTYSGIFAVCNFAPKKVDSIYLLDNIFDY